MNNRKLLFASLLGLTVGMSSLPWVSQAQDSAAPPSKSGQYVTDAALTAKVKTALLAEKGLKSTDINVETSGGTVQLSGFVVSSAQIDQAVDVARHVKGVKDVQNDLHLKTAAQ